MAALTGAQAIDAILERCGNQQGTDLRATVLREMRSTQIELEGGRTIPWFLLTEKTTTYVTVANTDYVDLGDAFLRAEDEAGGVWYKDTTRSEIDQWVRLERNSFQNMDAKFKDDEAAAPQQYAVVNETLYLRPVPDAAYELKILGYFRATELADDAASNSWLAKAEAWLTYTTATIIATVYLQNDALGQRLAQLAAGFRSRVVVETEARQHADQDYQMGDD
jgi:hypothetical protein